MENTKTRTWFASPVAGRKRSSVFAAWGNYYDNGVKNSETRTSVSHARLPGGRWSGGGPFFLSRQTERSTPSSRSIQTFTGGGSLLWEGTVRMGSPAGAVTPLSPPSMLSDGAMDALGTTAIARTMPVNPAFDLANYLGELVREGIPNAPGAQVKADVAAAKSAGREYLNYEFGWVPLVSGIRDFARVTRDADDILRKYQEESNKTLDRRYDWPVLQDRKFTSVNFNTVPGGAFFTGGGRESSYVQRTWFEVEYVYHIPAGGSYTDKFRRYASEARKLYGLDLSPEVLWNLAPWTWAIDWFSNAGDVIHNISAIGQDGLVIRHGYVMCHTRSEVIDTGFLQGQPFKRVTVSETKQRRPATPYGFGVSFGSLSPKQIAILSALGLSRW